MACMTGSSNYKSLKPSIKGNEKEINNRIVHYHYWVFGCTHLSNTYTLCHFNYADTDSSPLISTDNLSASHTDWHLHVSKSTALVDVVYTGQISR